MDQKAKIALLLLLVGGGVGIFYLSLDQTEKEAPATEVATLESVSVNRQKTLIEQVKTKPETVEQVAEALVEASVPVIAETQIPRELYPRQAAPDLNPEQLSSALSRTYNNYSSLRTETYRNPDSEFNRSVVTDLEASRIERTEKK